MSSYNPRLGEGKQPLYGKMVSTTPKRQRRGGPITPTHDTRQKIEYRRRERSRSSYPSLSLRLLLLQKRKEKKRKKLNSKKGFFKN